ncbi:hypothetical protein FBU30_007762 [Linnemannia zychae]|nr:hypothetical protein FBU30_007762 [Linnemannia zychae]
MSYENQRLFSEILFNLILFESAGQYDHVGNQLTCAEIAEAFRHARRMFEYNPENFTTPCDPFIRQYRLDTPEGVVNYMNYLSFIPIKERAYFPYTIVLHLANDGVCGGFGFQNDIEEHHTHVPALTASETELFLQSYADTVPTEFHDDFAVLIYAFREDVWYRNMCPTDVCQVSSGMEAVKTYTRLYNDKKRVVPGRSHVDEMKAPCFMSKLNQQNYMDELIERFVLRIEEQDFMTQEEWDCQVKELEETEISFTRYVALTDCMEEIQASQAATEKRKDEVNAVRQVVEKRLRQYYGKTIQVHLFGSFVSGLCSMTSDVDMTVYNFETYSSHHTPIVELANSLRSFGFQKVTSIPHARVPIASFQLSGISCDINLDGPMGVHNSKLIAAYAQIDDRFKTLWFSIKQIAHKNRIISASTGFLSSFALAIMLIVFLQDVVSPPILPRLQQSLLMTPVEIDGFDCSFDSSIVYASYGEGNPKMAGQLLMDFLYFFGYIFDYSRQEVHPRPGKIQDRSKAPPRRSLQDKRPKDWWMCVMDPFIEDRNVAGTCGKDNVVKIQTCFQRAYEGLQDHCLDEVFGI